MASYLLLIGLIIVPTATVYGLPLSHVCSPSGLQMTPSFTGNLNTLMDRFKTKFPAQTYYQDGIQAPGKDSVFANALCRADIAIAECRSCVSNAVTELRSKCPNNREAMIWYDHCMLKYSDTFYFAEVDNRDDFFYFSPTTVANKAELNAKSKQLLLGLASAASKTPTRFAYNFVPYDGKKLYGMVECTRDLSPANCEQCLKSQIDQIPQCCDGKEGGRVIGSNCNFRYEMNPF